MKPCAVSKAVKFNSEHLSAADVQAILLVGSTIDFQDCRSDEWRQIGSVLANHYTLHDVSILRCNTGDSILEGLCRNIFIRRLHVGNGNQMQSNAESPN